MAKEAEAKVKIVWTTMYLSERGGYECILTLEGDDTNEVLAEAKRILEGLQQQRIKPVRSRPAPPVPHRTIER